MSFNLKVKKVFITGSTKGIGLEIAKKLETYGCIIAINSRNKSSLENAYKGITLPVTINRTIIINHMITYFYLFSWFVLSFF